MSAPASRVWRLPTNDELDKEQDAILEAPDNASMLITGGPGTGKTTLALLHAMKRVRQGQRVVVLMFNNTLSDASFSQVGRMDAIPRITTAIKWAKEVCRQFYSIEPGRSYKVPWEKMEKRFYESERGDPHLALPFDAIIVDEGQDLPTQYYEFLKRHDVPVVVTADDQQCIKEGNADERQIAAILSIENDAIHPLKKNYRNPRQVFDFASAFHKGNERLPEPPAREGDRPKLVVTSKMKDYLHRLAEKHLDTPGELTLIVTHNHQRRLDILDTIQRTLPAGWVRTYPTGEWGSQLAFHQGGIVVLCAQSCKGLEFDNVVIAPINDFPLEARHEHNYRLLYVLATRTRNRLVLLQEPEPCPVAEHIEPFIDQLIHRYEYTPVGSSNS